MDMPDSTLVMVMTKGIGANLTNDEKRAHLIDLNRGHLIEQVCVQEILPPNRAELLRRSVSLGSVEPHSCVERRPARLPCANPSARAPAAWRLCR
jgi:hypothetical protein